MEKYYQNKLIKQFLLIVLSMSGANAWALSTDKDQPIEIEADSAELDNKKGVTIYRGNVVVTQGSIRMTGDLMTVYFTKESDLDYVILDGKPATYKQLPDKSEIYDEAEALRMEYYALKTLIVLIEKAQVKQEGLRFSGKRIEYDTKNSRVKAEGGIKHGTGEADDTDTKKERVKITIKPKKK